jgi:hypothetical protein
MAFVRLINHGPPPSPMGASRKVAGPIYELASVQNHLLQGQIKLITRDCLRDVLSLGWTSDNVVTLIQTLSSRHYRDSEWCMTSAPGSGWASWIDCDAYVIQYDVASEVENSLGKKMFVKFGARPSNELLLVVSCHES